MDRVHKRILIALLIIAPAVVVLAVFLLAPKAETPRDEALPEGTLEVVAAGPVRDGSADRAAGGVVKLFWNGTGHVLRFEDYEAEAGPNVWFFLVNDTDADDADEIETGGYRLHVPGPGQATYRGDFNVPLPAEVDPKAYGAVVAWDRTLNERFAVGVLERLDDSPADPSGATAQPNVP